MKYFPHVLLAIFVFFTFYHVIALYGAFNGMGSVALNAAMLIWNAYFAHDTYKRYFAQS